MASGHILLRRIPRHTVKTITFAGGVTGGIGEIGQDTVFNITGSVWLQMLSVRCTTSLAGATATLSLGTANDVDALIGVTTATDLIATEYWRDSTPTLVEVDQPILDYTVSADITIDTLVANITAGVLEFSTFWLPASLDGNLD